MIKKHFDQVMKQAGTVMKDFPWEDPMAYALWLKQTFYFVENSTRLIGLAGSLFPVSRNNLHQRFIDHCREERGHEKLLLVDIRHLGADPHELVVFASTQAFYQCQYYWIEHKDPISFFGYILFLEGLAVIHAPQIIERLTAAHGAKPLNFLKVHSSEDENHLEKAFELVKDTTMLEQKEIASNLQLSAELYFQFLAEIKTLANSLPRRKKMAG